MKRVFIIWSDLNQMGFGVEVNAKDYDKAKELALEGWHRWNCPNEYPEYEFMGYAEPATELLDEAEIEYKILDEDEITDPNNPDYCIKGMEVIC